MGGQSSVLYPTTLTINFDSAVLNYTAIQLRSAPTAAAAI